MATIVTKEHFGISMLINMPFKLLYLSATLKKFQSPMLGIFGPCPRHLQDALFRNLIHLFIVCFPITRCRFDGHGNEIIVMWLVANDFDLQYFIFHSLNFKLADHASNGRLKLVP